MKQPGVSEPDIDPNDAAAVAANFNPTEDANDQQVLSGRVALRWQPIDALDMKPDLLLPGRGQWRTHNL